MLPAGTFLQEDELALKDCRVPPEQTLYIPPTNMAITTPNIAPATTCRGVWPTYSFSFSWRNILSRFRIFSKNTLFRSFACFPVSMRTFMASYMTIIASTKLIANSKLPMPYSIPDAVVRAQTVAEWELGIPPEPKILSGLKDWFSTISIIVFNTWATSQPLTEHIKTHPCGT